MASSLEKLGKRIKLLRESRTLTQEGLEEASGVNARYISALERGTKNVTFDVLERLSRGLDIEMFLFFIFEDSVGPSKKSLDKYIQSLPPEKIATAFEILKALDKHS